MSDAEDLADALRAFEGALPGWWYTCGKCMLTGHASCGPDRQGADAFLLDHKEFADGFDADIDGSTPGEALREVTRLALDARSRITPPRSMRK